MSSSSPILVTGGAGFIGSNLVRWLLRETSEQVLVVDKLTYAGRLENLADVADDPRYSFVQADIADGPAMRALFLERRPRAVLNLAAESHVDRSIDEPGAFIRTNIVGTYELLEAARALAAASTNQEHERFRFLHVSTDEVYGSLGPSGFFTEQTAYAPNSPYSASKASADHLVRAYGQTFHLPVLITNCSNNYGPYQFPEKLIPVVILNALEGKPLPIYGDGGNVRDWLFVEDHCRGIWLTCERGVPGEKYNLGGDAERSNLELVRLLCDLLEREVPAATNPALTEQGHESYRDLITFVRDRPGHDHRYAIDYSKASRELGWDPSVDLAAGLTQTVKWYLANQEWCEAVSQQGYRRQRLGLAGVGAAAAVV